MTLLHYLAHIFSVLSELAGYVCDRIINHASIQYALAVALSLTLARGENFVGDGKPRKSLPLAPCPPVAHIVGAITPFEVVGAIVVLVAVYVVHLRQIVGIGVVCGANDAGQQ